METLAVVSVRMTVAERCIVVVAAAFVVSVAVAVASFEAVAVACCWE